MDILSNEEFVRLLEPPLGQMSTRLAVTSVSELNILILSLKLYFMHFKHYE